MTGFRALRADEVDVRVARVVTTRKDGQEVPKGVSLLLYKDARCDMNILDETVGAMNWQRAHSRDNANCTVSIWDADKGQWISKEDTGTESNTEAEKGLASDSFKRACFNWGIGRELYTAPFIWVPAAACKIRQAGPRWVCETRFRVTEMAVAAGRITALVVTDDKGTVMYELKADDGAIRCAVCGQPIKPGKRSDGSIWPASDIAAWTQRLHGRAMCWACHKEESKDAPV